MQAMDTAQLIALAGALGWASGVRLYLVVLLTGLAGFMGWIQLPQGLHLLAHPVVLGASGFMVFVEFFADKIPGLDSLWDVVHTMIRIPAGAALAAGVFGADSGLMALRPRRRPARPSIPHRSRLPMWAPRCLKMAWCRWPCGSRWRIRCCLCLHCCACWCSASG